MLGGLAPGLARTGLANYFGRQRTPSVSARLMPVGWIRVAISKGGEYETYRWFRKSGETI